MQTQNASLQQTAIQQTWLSSNISNAASTTASTDTRRMSEPSHTITDRKSPPPRPASVTLSPLKGNLTSDHHPNQAVVLDEVEEGEMVENKLVIPDEMVRYLNQVVDNQNDELNSLTWTEMDSNQKCLDQMIQSPGSFPQNSNMMSPVTTVNPVLSSPNHVNSFVPSPSNNLNTMLHSPAQPNFNQIIPSPSNNISQMMHSPSQPPLHPLMSSPARSTTQNDNMNPMPSASLVKLNQMMPSPSSNNNQMIPSPAANINTMMHSPASAVLSSPACNQLTQMIPSPASHYQLMASPSSTFGDMSNSAMPQASMDQISSVPTSNTVNRLQSRCNSQLGPANNANQTHCNATNMIANTQISGQNNHVVPNCYSRPMNNSCYNMQHWDGSNCQNNIMPQHASHNMCNNNQDFISQCRSQVSIMSPGYNMSQQVSNPPNQCTNHVYQSCNQNSFNYCQNKPINNFNCNSYQPMQSQPYNSIPNMTDPLPSPAMATPAPTEIINQPQQAQMSRPCTHYMPQNMQNCFQPQLPQYVVHSQQNSCNNCNNCQKTGYVHQQNQTNFIQHMNNELKTKMANPSQPSPGTAGNETTTLGMRQDTYQRTLEYVQNCQSWVNNSESSNSTMNFVKCGDKPSSNMVVNDMTSSLSSLLEENRYLQMIQ